LIEIGTATALQTDYSGLQGVDVRLALFTPWRRRHMLFAPTAKRSSSRYVPALVVVAVTTLIAVVPFATAIVNDCCISSVDTNVRGTCAKPRDASSAFVAPPPRSQQ
jgi:hypothetical protein